MTRYAKDNVPETTTEPLWVARSVLNLLGSLSCRALACGTGSRAGSGSKAKFQTTDDEDRKGNALCRNHKWQ
jgi:hypothetical protein